MFRYRMTKIRNAMKVAFRVFIFGVTFLSFIDLLHIGIEYYAGTKEYQALQETVSERFPATKGQVGTDKSHEEKWKTEQILAGIKELKEKNTDTVGWIAFDTIDISYPIMQGEDNAYYLKHTFGRKENKSGSIFMEVGNTPDFNDYHTILYGHNMKNGSMFGRLKQYREKSFFEENPCFSIYTEEERYRYEIFSVQVVKADSWVYTIGYCPNKEYQAFLQKLVKNSWYGKKAALTVTDKVITLSTCAKADDERLVIHAKRSQS